MILEFKQCKLVEVSQSIERYIKNLSSPFDSYLDDHIITSQFYKVMKDSIVIGYLAVYEEKLLTQFYIDFEYLKYAQNIFKEALATFNIESAYVCTADELFLSLACDLESKVIENQAYFFQHNAEGKEEIKLYDKGALRLATEEDIDQIKAISKDFFEDVDKQVKEKKIFVFIEDHIYLGFGITEKGEFLKGYTSIGMFTNEAYRQKGIGRTIISKLKDLCYENGEVPICGCWYYNTNSKNTLESSGFVTKTRLLNIRIV